MNAKMKKSLGAVSGIIVIVVIVLLAVVGARTAARSVSVAEALEGGIEADQKIQVSGNVVPGSFSTTGNVLTFKIYDPDGSPSDQLEVRYEGAASSTFGNEVSAICTGRLDEGGVLMCAELVTKCPSKYENADEALSVARLLDYGEGMVGTVVKVTGTVEAGTLAAAGLGDRFVILDSSEDPQGLPDAEKASLAVAYDGALSEEVADGSSVVLTGYLSDEGTFCAAEVALEG